MARAVTTKRAQLANKKALDRSVSNLNKVLGSLKISGPQGLAMVAIAITNQVRINLSQPGTGRIYKVGKSPTASDKRSGRSFRSHRASAPGEPPAVDQNRLRPSYVWVPGVLPGLISFVDIGTNVESAPHLEFGTRRMAARPHFRPAIAVVAATYAPQVMREQIVKGEKITIAQLKTATGGLRL